MYGHQIFMELELQTALSDCVCGCWDPNPGPPEKQLVLLSAKWDFFFLNTLSVGFEVVLNRLFPVIACIVFIQKYEEQLHAFISCIHHFHFHYRR